MGSIRSPMRAQTRSISVASLWLAIGKEGIVGDVDVARIGARLDDLAKHGQTRRARN